MPATEPAEKSHFQWLPAIEAGLISGIILLILPHASPWEGLTLFTPAIVGRVVPATWGMSNAGIIVLHLAISLIYGILVSLAVMNVRQLRAVLVGGVVGLVLYVISFGIVSLLVPDLRGNEFPVIITHIVFGLVAAGAYRGLLRRAIPAPIRFNRIGLN